MTPTDFTRLVFTMRTKQKQYYQKRMPARLIAAKQIEAEVDKQLDIIAGQQMLPLTPMPPADEIPY